MAKGTARYTLQLDTSQFSSNARAAKKEFLGLKGGAADLARVMAGGLGIGGGVVLFQKLTSAVAESVEVAIRDRAELEKLEAQVRALTTSGAQDIAAFEQNVTSLTMATGKTAAELGRALYFVESAGIHGADALQAVEVSAKAAAVGLGDSATVARLVVSAMNAYGPSTLSAADAVDKLIEIVKQGGASADEYAGALGRVLPIAAQLGVSLDELGGFLAIMTRQGVSGEEAVTSLRGTLNALAAPGEKASKVLASVGLSAEGLQHEIREKGLAATLQTLMEALHGNVGALADAIPNVRALTGVLAVATNQSEVYAQAVKAIQSSHGDLAKAIRETTDTIDFQEKRLAATRAAMAAEGMGGVFGKLYLDYLKAQNEALEAQQQITKQLREVGPPARGMGGRPLNLESVQGGGILPPVGVPLGGIFNPPTPGVTLPPMPPLPPAPKLGAWGEIPKMNAQAAAFTKTVQGMVDAEAKARIEALAHANMIRAIEVPANKELADLITSSMLPGMEDQGSLMAELDHRAGELSRSFHTTAKETFDWKNALQGAALIAGLFGGSVESVVGVLGNMQKAFKDAETGADKFNAIASGVGQIGGIIGGKVGGALQGAAGGAMMGMSLGGPIGAAIGGIAGGIMGLFGHSDPVKKAAEEAGSALGFQVSRSMADEFLKQSQATGQTVAQVAKEWLKEQAAALRTEGLKMMEEGVRAQVEVLANLPKRYGQIAAYNFNATFWEYVHDNGLVQAMNVFGDIFSKLGDYLPDELKALAKAIEDPQTKAKLQFLQGQTQVVTGGMNAGVMLETGKASNVIAQDTLSQLKSQGVSDKVAYQAIGGLLQAELNASIASGRTMDAGLQKLIDEAADNGVVITGGIPEQQLQVLRAIYSQMGGKGNPNSTTTGGTSAGDTAGGGGGGNAGQGGTGQGGGKAGKGTHERPMAGGGVVFGPTHALLGEGGHPEVVTPFRTFEQMAAVLDRLERNMPRQIARAVRDAVAMGK